MPTHSCYKCNKVFNQKGHLDRHLNKKRTCQKCDKNFKTEWAYINGQAICVNDYINKKNKDKK